MIPDSDIVGILIQKFDFKTAVNDQEFSLFGYNYLSIIADGAINPLVNYPGVLGVLEEDFYLKFRDGMKLMINGEILNLPVKDRKMVRLRYQGASAGNSTYQGGYGAFYMILSQEKIPGFKFMPRPPSICTTVDIPATSTVTYWFGPERPEAGYILGVPFIPLGYRKLCYWVESSSADFSFTLYGYSKYYATTLKSLFTTVANVTLTEIDCLGANRYRLDMVNNAASTRPFSFHLVWYDRQTL